MSGSGVVGTLGGPGGVTGSVSALAGASSAVTVYCGTYTINPSSAAAGSWNLVSDGSTVSGGAATMPLSGSAVGSTITITSALGSATGTIGGASVSGTWTAIDGHSGTWRGSSTGCSGSSSTTTGWVATGSLSQPRIMHTATLLLTDEVLVTGGHCDAVAFPTTCPNGTTPVTELYDPGSGTWRTTANLVQRRANHTATLLQDGRVLVAGGSAGGAGVTAFADAEIFDPGAGVWTATRSMTTPRSYHTATLLPDGRALVAGGVDSAGIHGGASAEIFDPAASTWSTTGSLPLARIDAGAALLPSGKVLMAGGVGQTGSALPCAVYNPATASWTSTGSLSVSRVGFPLPLIVLPGGKALTMGGEAGTTGTGEIYDPATGGWTLTSAMVTQRIDHAATLLADGKVLVVAGRNSLGVYLSSAELY